MSHPPTSRAWFALIAGITVGYLVLAGMLWLQNDRIGVVALGFGLAGALLSLRELRRPRCARQRTDTDGDR